MLQWDTVAQGFSTIFDSRHPFLVIKQFGGTPSYNLIVHRHQIQNLVAPIELLVAPRLRTTAVATRLFMDVFSIFICFTTV